MPRINQSVKLSRRSALKAGAAGLTIPFVAAHTSRAASSNSTWTSVNMGRAQDNVTLQVTVWLGDAEFAAMEELAGIYTESHPNVTVEYINIVDGGPWGRDQLQRMIAGGTPPDLMMMNTGQFESFGSRGALAELDERVSQDGLDLAVYWEPAVEGCKIDGKLYGLPKDISDHVVYINTEFFAEAGVELPSNEWTWDDYKEVCKALTRDSDGDGQPDRWGIGIVNSSWSWGSFVHTNGGEIMNAERTECLLGSEEAKAALTSYYSVITEPDGGAVPPGAMPQLEGASDQFLGGVTGMNMAGPWFRPNLVEKPLFDWTIRLYPRPAADKPPVSVLYTDQWAMSSTTDAPDEAWSLLKFLGGPEGLLAWSEIYGSRSIAPLKEITSGDKWLNYGGEAHRVDNELILSQLERTVPPATNFGDGSTVENIWNDQLDLVIVGQQDIETAVSTIVSSIDSELS